MRRAVLPLLGLACFLGLLLVIYRPVLLEDGQFAWDNASYLYYPLYLPAFQQEWISGRWPLWDPGQNGGEPCLLGNPITAVLYPGKNLVCVSHVRLGCPALRDRPYHHRIPGNSYGSRTISRSRLAGILSRGPELCIRGTGSVPLLQRGLSGRRWPGCLGVVVVLTGCSESAPLGRGRNGLDPGSPGVRGAIQKRPT